MTGSRQSPRPSVHAAIRKHFGALPKSERRLAELVLNFPGDLASYTATELAAIAEVSNAAVSRFVRRLGFANYDEMRRIARREQEEGAPLYLLGHDKAGSAAALVERHIDAVVGNLRATFSPDSVADDRLPRRGGGDRAGRSGSPASGTAGSSRTTFAGR